ncbi:DUF1540 domain-containing protein [Paenibacillus sp. R14(2021)]|uniref:DUF1540 domain-containing protein n=1 Tax=Paenibacillus sp. R14(2021) TaxID=2859228 RepID=UPI001C6164AF|nr:DUF1540 domain-containing protein [Paenibacillus sp. R14(2021)]
MPNGVSCSVANCSFWNEGNQCGADKIEVDIDRHAQVNFGSEFAQEGFGDEHQDAVARRASTCCHTFKAKE